MTDKVCDASAVAAVLFAEPDFERVLARIAGHTLYAPTLLPYEIASIARKKLRRHPDGLEIIAGALDRFARMDVLLEPVAPDQAFAVATQFGLSTYDASYLWLARIMNLELVTLDKQLERAAIR